MRVNVWQLKIVIRIFSNINNTNLRGHSSGAFQSVSSGNTNQLNIEDEKLSSNRTKSALNWFAIVISSNRNHLFINTAQVSFLSRFCCEFAQKHSLLRNAQCAHRRKHFFYLWIVNEEKIGNHRPSPMWNKEMPIIGQLRCIATFWFT